MSVEESQRHGRIGTSEDPCPDMDMDESSRKNQVAKLAS
jgi:hypothetical protein